MPLFIPAFEGVWAYQSFLPIPTEQELAANPGASITAKKWAKGKLQLADGVEMEAAGILTFAPGVELAVHLKFVPANDGGPAKFEATGRGETGPTLGAVYALAGWAVPSANGKLVMLHGAVRAMRGPDVAPEKDLAGDPVGSLGSFVIQKA